MKLLLLNSCGPMGSALLSGLVEKIGVRNLPIRDLGLNEYITGELSLDSKYMEKQTVYWIERFARPVQFGGVGVVDRDSRPARVLTDPGKVRERIAFLQSHRFTSLAELFHTCRDVFAEALVYKEAGEGWAYDGHLCRHLDFFHRAPERFWEQCQHHFPGARIIHLHRDVGPWLESMASQAMHQRTWRARMRFEFTHVLRKYRRYEKFCQAVPGEHLHFEELFTRPVDELAAQLANALSVSLPALDWTSLEYDLYGALTAHSTAFTLADAKHRFLGTPVLDRMLALEQPEEAPLPKVLLGEGRAQVLYWKALRAYRKRMKGTAT